jgi:hypothetical protein
MLLLISLAFHSTTSSSRRKKKTNQPTNQPIPLSRSSTPKIKPQLTDPLTDCNNNKVCNNGVRALYIYIQTKTGRIGNYNPQPEKHQIKQQSQQQQQQKVPKFHNFRKQNFVFFSMVKETKGCPGKRERERERERGEEGKGGNAQGERGNKTEEE